jgi:hypothetical protein
LAASDFRGRFFYGNQPDVIYDLVRGSTLLQVVWHGKRSIYEVASVHNDNQVGEPTYEEIAIAGGWGCCFGRLP